jgi:TRAP-type C4-dicarboxylate transport system permease small subunit
MIRPLAGTALVLSLSLVMFEWIGAAWIGLLLGGTLAYGRSAKVSAGEAFRRLDDTIFAGEKVIVSVAFLVMSFAVFLDVVWRNAHGFDARTAVGFGAGAAALCFAGAFTARWPSATPAKRAAAGLAATAVFAIGTLAIYAAPNGFGWSQKLALSLLLWVGLLGSSMATKEGRHIAVDAVRRVLPQTLVRPFEIAASLVTTLLCGVLAVLAVQYCRANLADWIESEGTSSVFESLPIPYWAATVSIPIGFGLMAARFLGVAITGAKEVDVLTSLGGGDLVEEPK